MPATVLVSALGLLLVACGTASGPAPQPGGADLGGFPKQRIRIEAVEIEAWLAETPAQQQQGLMGATLPQLAPLPDGTPRGMLFVFPAEMLVAFTMRDTIVPLDLAFFDAEGTLLEIRDLVPLVEVPVVSTDSVQFALEVLAGTLAGAGIGVGDRLALPLARTAARRDAPARPSAPLARGGGADVEWTRRAADEGSRGACR